MIILNGDGRLGNQFFQEIFCRYVKYILGIDIIYDGNSLKYHCANGHETVQVFNFREKNISRVKKALLFGPNCIELPPRFKKFGGWREQRKRAIDQKKLFVLEEKEPFQKAEELNELYRISGRKNIMIEGRFLNHYYFDSVKDHIQDELSFRRPLSGKNKEIARKMENENSVGIHIRQGDYKNEPVLNVLNSDYYSKAIRIIYEKAESPVFYVFSEEPADQYLSEAETFQYIDWNKGLEAHCDIQLMTHCKYLIIANSTFSYMAALLNKNKKNVIMPKMYSKTDSFDSAPNDWIRV